MSLKNIEKLFFCKCRFALCKHDEYHAFQGSIEPKVRRMTIGNRKRIRCWFGDVLQMYLCGEQQAKAEPKNLKHDYTELYKLTFVALWLAFLLFEEEKIMEEEMQDRNFFRGRLVSTESFDGTRIKAMGEKRELGVCFSSQELTG